jgi:hypothetical protein
MRRFPTLTRAQLYRSCVGNEVRAILLPGRTPRYNVADVERMVQSRLDNPDRKKRGA